jgi:hypothetical protein
MSDLPSHLYRFCLPPRSATTPPDVHGACNRVQPRVMPFGSAALHHWTGLSLADLICSANDGGRGPRHLWRCQQRRYPWQAWAASPAESDYPVRDLGVLTGAMALALFIQPADHLQQGKKLDGSNRIHACMQVQGDHTQHYSYFHHPRCRPALAA